LFIVASCALLFGAHCEDGIGPSDFACEVAVAQLADCCPNFEPGEVNCVTNGDGCGYSALPDLERDESDCIRRMSCSDLRAHGVCDRVAKSPPGIDRCDPDVFCADGSVPRNPVCP
jgi:hypothetical protein